jgi:ABC-2 type transport system permease protein
MTALGASIGFQPTNLWSYVLKLLRLRWLIFASGFKHARLARKLVTIFLALLAVGACVGCYFLTTAFLNFVDSPLIVESGIDLGAFVKAIPALIVSFVFLGILLLSFGVLLQGLYLANDMDFLLSAPVPIRAVFLTKLLQAILPNFVIVVCLGLPVLFGLGASAGYHFLYYPLALMVLAFLSLTAAGISSLLVMAVVRIFPARRVAEVLALLTMVIIMVFSQLGNLAGIKSESMTPGQISQITGILSSFNTAWSPLAWAGRGLVELGEQRWISGIFFLALTMAISGALFWMALNAAERLYYNGWATLQVSVQSKKNHHTAGRHAARAVSAGILGHLLRSQIGAIVLKDFKELLRDLRNLSQVIGIPIMGVVFAVMLLRGGGEMPAGRGEAPDFFMDLGRLILAYGSMLVSLFVGWGLLSRLALISFSMEGRSYWILKTAPVSAGKQLAAKFLIAYLPSLALAWLYLLAVALLQRVPATTILYGLLSIALIMAGLCGINLALGVRGANVNWTDPRKMESGIGGCLGTIISMAYQLAALVLFFGPPIGLPLLGLSEGLGQVAGLLVGGAATLVCTFLPLKMVKGWVYRIGEE